jgi:hypothetical protein
MCISAYHFIISFIIVITLHYHFIIVLSLLLHYLCNNYTLLVIFGYL